MSVNSNTYIGWYVTIDRDLCPYQCCEKLAEITDNEYWSEFISETNIPSDRKICVINRGKVGYAILDPFIPLEFNLEFDGLPPQPEKLVQFTELFLNKYGDDSIQMCYGLLVFTN